MYIENNIYTKIKVYQILHVFILAVCKSLYIYHELQSVTLDANYLVCIAQTNSIWSQWRKKTHLRESKFLTPLLSRRPLLFQSNINFKVIVHAAMGKQRTIVTVCYYIGHSQYGSMNYSRNERITVKLRLRPTLLSWTKEEMHMHFTFLSTGRWNLPNNI